MQKAMRLCLVLAAGLLVLGCERESSDEATEEQAADTVAGAATISLADISGTWNMRAVPETGADTTATISQVQATADGWTLFLADRDPIEGAVTTSGDSIIVEAGPYESVRRAGVMVRTRSAYRLEGDRLVGTTVAHYATSDADSVLRLHVEGTRAPALAQDPVVVDPGHYKVEFENDQVRVLRITYGPNEKSVMHYHPTAVGVFLDDMKVQFTLPDGQTVEDQGKAGEATWTEAGPHLPQNLTDQPFELILVELKSQSPGDD